MSFNDEVVFLLGPLVLFDVRIEVVVPSLTTLLANPARERSCYL
jgi:hypothetical protein